MVGCIDEHPPAVLNLITGREVTRSTIMPMEESMGWMGNKVAMQKWQVRLQWKPGGSESLSIYLCVAYESFMWLMSSQPDASRLLSSYFMAAAVTAAMAALCCSIVPPLSNIRILLRAAIGQPDALSRTWNRWKTVWSENECELRMLKTATEPYLRWDKNFPVEWPDPSLRNRIRNKIRGNKWSKNW